MFKKIISVLLLIFILTINSCSSDNNNDDIEIVNDENDDTGDTGSIAANGCSNVVIFNNIAYGACEGEIEVVNLMTLERNLLNISADDITIDTSTGQLFTQTEDTVQVLNLDNPMEPNIVATIGTNFSLFSGLSAANGVLVVSGGSINSNTQVYNYTTNSITLVTDGIPTVDSIVSGGNPDVHVTATENGATAFYSQDISNAANWAIQVIELNSNGQVIPSPVPPVPIVLTPGQYTGTFNRPIGPANFPLESEFLNDQLYVANFAARGLEVIDFTDNSEISLIPLNYEPINVATDGRLLFVIGLTENRVDIIDPAIGGVTETIDADLVQPTGVDSNATHIVIADKTNGLVVIPRT